MHAQTDDGPLWSPPHAPHGSGGGVDTQGALVSLALLRRELRSAEGLIPQCALARRGQREAEQLQEVLTARVHQLDASARRLQHEVQEAQEAQEGQEGQPPPRPPPPQRGASDATGPHGCSQPPPSRQPPPYGQPAHPSVRAREASSAQLRVEVKHEVREEMYGVLRAEAREEVMLEVREEVRAELREEVEEEVRMERSEDYWAGEAGAIELRRKVGESRAEADRSKAALSALSTQAEAREAQLVAEVERLASDLDTARARQRGHASEGVEATREAAAARAAAAEAERRLAIMEEASNASAATVQRAEEQARRSAEALHAESAKVAEMQGALRLGQAAEAEARGTVESLLAQLKELHAICAAARALNAFTCPFSWHCCLWAWASRGPRICSADASLSPADATPSLPSAPADATPSLRLICRRGRQSVCASRARHTRARRGHRWQRRQGGGEGTAGDGGGKARGGGGGAGGGG